ncbi:hypothetical protein ACFLR4_03590 [Bacteroidota bacterium]
MDLLVKEEGTTIIEVLVGLTILGIVMTLSLGVMVKIYGNPKIVSRQEALMLADQEITNCINTRAVTDTVYTNPKGNLFIERSVSSRKNINDVSVSVYSSSSEQLIVSLSVSIVE